MRLVFLTIIALLTVGCNSTETTIIEGEGNSSIRVSSSQEIECGDILEVRINAYDGNVTIGDNNYSATGNMMVDYYIYADCEDDNITEVDDNGSD